jgi:hypothetical protein
METAPPASSDSLAPSNPSAPADPPIVSDPPAPRGSSLASETPTDHYPPIPAAIPGNSNPTTEWNSPTSRGSPVPRNSRADGRPDTPEDPPFPFDDNEWYEEESQYESVSPFTGEWAWFGFEGDPQPGVDYSWMEIQTNLMFAGRVRVIRHCQLSFSSRSPYTFLVRTRAQVSTIWNVIDCAFSMFGTRGSTVRVTRGDRNIMLLSTSAALLNLLAKIGAYPRIQSTFAE